MLFREQSHLIQAVGRAGKKMTFALLMHHSDWFVSLESAFSYEKFLAWISGCSDDIFGIDTHINTFSNLFYYTRAIKLKLRTR